MKTLLCIAAVAFMAPAFAGDKDENPFAYLELKTYEEARKKVLEGQAVYLFVGVPDRWAGTGAYVYHCHVPSEVMKKYFMPLWDGEWSCYLDKHGKPMARLITPKTKPVKECK